MPRIEVRRPLLAVVCRPKLAHKAFATIAPGMLVEVRGTPDAVGMVRIRIDEEDFLVFQADLNERSVVCALTAGASQ